MPAPGLTFPFGPGSVTVGEDGRIAQVLADSGGSSYLTGGGSVVATLAGRAVEWSTPTVAADVDEVEFGYGSAVGLGLIVRHAFTTGWGVRIVLTNLSGAELELPSCRLAWEPPLDHPAWVLAAGVAGAMAIQPPDGSGPLLGGRLTMGTCVAAGPDGLDFGPLSLGSGGRYVVAWQWDWYRTARAFDQGSFPSVPRRFYLPVDQAVTIASDPDEAVVALGVHVEPVRGQLELSSALAGRFEVAVNAARGVTRYDLDWVPSRDEVLEAAATEAMSQPASGAGLVRLADVDAALLVQWAVIRGSFAHPYSAEDALEVFAAEIAETEVSSPRAAGFVCGEFERTGQGELLELATDWLLRTPTAQPGVGLAGARICLSRILAGRPVAAVTGHLAGLARTPSAGRSLLDQAAVLELDLLTMARPPSRTELRRVTAALAAIGPWLGAGLKGRAVRPLDPDALAYLASVLALTSEEVSTSMRRRWGTSARELGEDALAEALARLTGESARPAHGWLVLSGPALDDGG